MRILVLLAIALLLYVIITNLLRKAKGRPEALDHSEEMVACDLCGLHVVERESFKEGGRVYCCHDHLELDQRKQ